MFCGGQHFPRCIININNHRRGGKRSFGSFLHTKMAKSMAIHIFCHHIHNITLYYYKIIYHITFFSFHFFLFASLFNLYKCITRAAHYRNLVRTIYNVLFRVFVRAYYRTFDFTQSIQMSVSTVVFCFFFIYIHQSSSELFFTIIITITQYNNVNNYIYIYIV